MRMPLEVGMRDRLHRTVTAGAIEVFRMLTGDDNPVHQGDDAIAHGVLIEGYISALLGTRLPGPGAVLLRLSVSFLSPAKPGDHLLVKGVITDIRPTSKGDRAIITMMVDVEQAGSLPVATGTALLMVPIEAVVLPEPSTDGE